MPSGDIAVQNVSFRFFKACLPAGFENHLEIGVLNSDFKGFEFLSSFSIAPSEEISTRVDKELVRSVTLRH
jgi:hypothetical protein